LLRHPSVGATNLRGGWVRVAQVANLTALADAEQDTLDALEQQAAVLVLEAMVELLTPGRAPNNGFQPWDMQPENWFYTLQNHVRALLASPAVGKLSVVPDALKPVPGPQQPPRAPPGASRPLWRRAFGGPILSTSPCAAHDPSRPYHAESAARAEGCVQGGQQRDAVERERCGRDATRHVCAGGQLGGAHRPPAGAAHRRAPRGDAPEPGGYSTQFDVLPSELLGSLLWCRTTASSTGSSAASTAPQGAQPTTLPRALIAVGRTARPLRAPRAPTTSGAWVARRACAC
jgi:hypothetical protein